MRIVLELEGERFEVELQRTSHGVKVECDGLTLDLVGVAGSDAVELRDTERSWRIVFESDDRALVQGKSVGFHVASFTPGQAAGASGEGRIPVRAVMHGRLVKVLAQPGQSVARGEPLFVLEAMKMQNELASPADGVLSEVVAKAGDVVDVGRVLGWLERRKE